MPEIKVQLFQAVDHKEAQEVQVKPNSKFWHQIKVNDQLNTPAVLTYQLSTSVI
jgi:hypothetical protein